MPQRSITRAGSDAVGIRPRAGALPVISALVLVSVLVGALALTGCAGTPSAHPTSSTATPLPEQTLPEPVTTDLAPGATIDVDAASVEDRAVPDGFRVAVVTAPPGDQDAIVTAVDGALDAWAARVGVPLDVTATTDPAQVFPALDAARAAAPDVVIAVGEGVVDELDLLSAQSLEQQYLVIGAQLPEPTENVTAVVWDGATGRGSEAGHDPGTTASATVSATIATAAVDAGIASILDGVTGYVLHLG